MTKMTFIWSLFSDLFLILVLEVSLIHCFTPFEPASAPH